MATRNTNQVATYLPQNVSDQLKAVADRHKWSMALTRGSRLWNFCNANWSNQPTWKKSKIKRWLAMCNKPPLEFFE